MAELTGKWAITVHTFMGDQRSTHDIKVDGNTVSGTITDGGNGSQVEFTGGTTDGTNYSYEFEIKAAIGKMKFKMEGALQEDGTLKGVSANAMGKFDYDGVRAE